MFTLAACSSSSKSEEAKISSDSSAPMDLDSGRKVMPEKPEVSFDNNAKQDEIPSTTDIEVPSQMVIYQADLQLRVKKFEQTLQSMKTM